MTSIRPQPSTTWDTSHEDMIHDLQMDYYGRRLATCSSDSLIKIFEVSAEGQTLSATIAGHEGPVWQVAWAHPKFGPVLASCSFDRRVCIWKELPPQSGQWSKIYEFTGHQSSVNSISFAPHELGLRLACASADCTISILTWRGGGDGDWDERTLPNAHQIGCNAVSWAPAAAPASATAQVATPLQAMFVTGGCDGAVRVWRLLENGEILPDPSFDTAYRSSPHSGWVRDVAWAPSIGMPVQCVQTIASCAEDKMVHIWTYGASKEWVCKKLPPFEAVVWRLSWSCAGNVLAVSAADGKVTLWKEGLSGEWALIESIQEP